MQKLFYTLSLCIFVSACTEERYPAKIELSPGSPIVINTDFQIAESQDTDTQLVTYRTITANWFKTKVKISNQGENPITVITVDFLVTQKSQGTTSTGTTAPSTGSGTSGTTTATESPACTMNVTGETQVILPGTSMELRSANDLAPDANFQTSGGLNGEYFYCQNVASSGSNYVQNFKVVLNGWQGTTDLAASRLLAYDFFQTQ